MTLKKKKKYVRYVDDILSLADNIDNKKKNDKHFKIKKNSVLKFPNELNINYKIPFLDALIDANNNNFSTCIYKKKTY